MKMPDMRPSRATSGCAGPSVVTLDEQVDCRENFIQTAMNVSKNVRKNLKNETRQMN